MISKRRPDYAVAYCKYHRRYLSKRQIKISKCLNQTKRLRRRHDGKHCRWLNMLPQEGALNEQTNEQIIPNYKVQQN